MAGNLYLTATESRSGKSVVALGVMEMLLRTIERVGFFRPVVAGEPAVSGSDHDISLIASRFALDIPGEYDPDNDCEQHH